MYVISKYKKASLVALITGLTFVANVSPRVSMAAGGCDPLAFAPQGGSCTGSPNAGTARLAEPPTFKNGWRLTLKETHRNPSDRDVRRQVAAWVAHRLFPHPTALQTRRLQSEVAHLAAKPFPLRRQGTGTLLYVTITKETLNQIAKNLTRAVNRAASLTRVMRIQTAGGPPRENAFATQVLAPLVGAEPAATISDTLYALSQIPGFSRADGLLVPDLKNPLDQTLRVQVTPTPAFAGSQLEVDNYGYAPTGAVVLNATGSALNAGTPGGLLTVTASTAGAGMTSGQVAYSLPRGLSTRVGGDLQAMNYSLDNGLSPWGHGSSAGALAALGVSGDNYSGDLWSTQTLLRHEDRRLTVKELAFAKAYQDTYSPTEQNARVIVGGTLDLSASRTLGKVSLSGDLSDTEYSLSQGAGSSPNNPFYYDTRGFQNYVQGNAQGVYVVSPTYSVTLGTIDQQYIGGGTLDPMLQGTLGGVYTIMALPTAALFGNDMYVGTLTFTRSDLTKKGLFQSSLFFDAGQVTGIGTAYTAMGPGVEESWSLSHYFAKVDIAVPVGALPASALGTTLTALTGGNIGQGGMPLQLWLSAGIRY